MTAKGNWVWKIVCTKEFCKRAGWIVRAQGLHTWFKLPSWKRKPSLAEEYFFQPFQQTPGEEVFILLCYQSSAWLRSLIWPTTINAFQCIWNASKWTITAGPILKMHPIHTTLQETLQLILEHLVQHLSPADSKRYHVCTNLCCQNAPWILGSLTSTMVMPHTWL